jgi:iron complex outermembrane receptor protein
VPYTVVGFLATQRVRRYKLFFNVENLTDVRQSKYSPILLPTPRTTGEWTTGVWGPLEGRVFSAGLRISSGDLAGP